MGAHAEQLRVHHISRAPVRMQMCLIRRMNRQLKCMPAKPAQAHMITIYAGNPES